MFYKCIQKWHIFKRYRYTIKIFRKYPNKYKKNRFTKKNVCGCALVLFIEISVWFLFEFKYSVTHLYPLLNMQQVCFDFHLNRHMNLLFAGKRVLY